MIKGFVFAHESGLVRHVEPKVKNKVTMKSEKLSRCLRDIALVVLFD